MSPNIRDPVPGFSACVFEIHWRHHSVFRFKHVYMGGGGGRWAVNLARELWCFKLTAKFTTENPGIVTVLMTVLVIVLVTPLWNHPSAKFPTAKLTRQHPPPPLTCHGCPSGRTQKLCGRALEGVGESAKWQWWLKRRDTGCKQQIFCLFSDHPRCRGMGVVGPGQPTADPSQPSASLGQPPQLSTVLYHPPQSLCKCNFGSLQQVYVPIVWDLSWRETVCDPKL